MEQVPENEAESTAGVAFDTTPAPVEVGEVVVFHDPTGTPHKALATAVWTPTCINVVIVSSDPNRRDDYGRQIERVTSLQHASVMPVHGNYWRREGEPVNPYVAPTSV